MTITPDEKVKRLRNFIKYVASNKALTLRDVMERVSELYGRNSSVSNFTGKIRRGSLSVIELIEILEVLTVEVEFKSGDDNLLL